MPNTPEVDNLALTNLKRTVVAGGGKWVGIQHGLTEEIPPFVLFNSPSGTTLAIPVNEITAEKVHAKLLESEKQFKIKNSVRVPRATIVKLIELLQEAPDEK